jgi:signal peptidase I
LDIEESKTDEAEPYRRRIWISVILTFFGIGLPLIYCGRLKAGILLELGSSILSYGLFSLLAFIQSTYLILAILGVMILFFMAILIFNIRFTRRCNAENIPRFENAWTWIIGVFVAMIILGNLPSFFSKTFFVEAHKMPATSMEKTLLVGDFFMVDKTVNAGELEYGDLIIFKYPKDPSQNYLKRLIARGGDRVRIENKRVFLNDSQLNEPYVQFTEIGRSIPYYDRGPWGAHVRDNMPEITVPEGKFFVLGDNRDNSADSRFWGYVDEELVECKARFIYFSWDSDNSTVRWDRIGKRLDLPSTIYPK